MSDIREREKEAAIKELIEEFQEEEGAATNALRLLQRLSDAEDEVARLREENAGLIDRIHSLSGSA